MNTIPLLPLTRGAFSLHLVRDEAGTEGEPFVRAGDLPGERRYLAVLKSETGAEAARMKLQLPAEDLDPLLDEEEGVSGPRLEARWAAARRDLEALAAAPRHFPSLVLPSGEEHPEIAALLPPVFFCPVPERLFHVPCPSCLASLHTCRDDAVLAAADLPTYSASSTRLLHCPAEHPEDDSPRFHFVEGEVPEELAGKGVGGLSELRQRLAATLDRRAEEEDAALAEQLPCATCPEAGPCLGRGGDGKKASAKAGTSGGTPRWLLFNSHDSPFLVTQPSGEPFEELLDRLGGRPQDGDRSPDLGLLFSPAGSGVDAVEILALKLAAFRQLVRAVREYYRTLGLPHLDLHPAQIEVDMPARGDELPALWSFQVKLLGTSSTRLRKLESGVEVLRPPSHLKLPYSSPAVRASYLLGTRRGEVVLERLEPAEEQDKAWRIVGSLFDPDGIFPEPTPRDWLVLTWADGSLGAGSRTTAARLLPADEEDEERPRLLRTEPVELPAKTFRKLDGARGLRIPRVAYRVYPRLGIDDDLYSLGVLLLRSLLVNDRQDLRIVETIVSAAAETEPRLDLELMLERHGPSLASSNVFYQETDRLPGRPNAIPDDLWHETLRLALGLLDAPARRGAGAADQDAQQRLDRLWLALGSLLRRLQLILFYRQPMHLEIRSLISELLAEEADRG